MACNAMNRCVKSCVRYYNDAVQPVTADATVQLAVAGSRVVSTGTAVDVEPNSYTTLRTGLYHLSSDVVFECTTAGDLEFNVLMDGVVLPCMTRSLTPTVGYNEIHTETDLYLSGCCPCVSHTFTYQLVSTGAVGSVLKVCTGIIKNA